MLVGKAIELVYIKIAGGRLGTDLNIYRDDIRALLPAALNEAVRDNQLLAIKLREDFKFLPDQFISTYEDVPVKFSTSRELKYVDFPTRPMALIDNEQNISILPMVGDEEFYYMHTRHQDVGYETSLGKTTRFWVEGKRAMFKNISPVVASVLMQYIASVDDLSDDDEMPCPVGYEMQVIDRMYKFWVESKFTTGDELVDNIQAPPNQNNKP